MNSHRIVGIGEILWDLFPDGARFGGAPANFACSAAGLGRERVDVFVGSGVGSDELGRRAINFLQERSVDTSGVAIREEPTGQVIVDLDKEGRASYQFAEDTAWDNLEWNDDLKQLAMTTDAVCFGTLGQRSERSRATIRQFVSATPSTALRVLDVNLRTPYVTDAVILDSLQLANVLKLNDDELPLVARLCEMTGNDSEVMQQLSARYKLKLVALTRGASGAKLLRGKEISDCKGIETDVIDTVGAGDAFTAAMVLGLLNDSPLEEINQTAGNVAAFVCAHSGATPPLPALQSFVSTSVEK